LPDTIWYPEDALGRLPQAPLSFLCFPVEQPQFFDAVVTDDDDRVVEIQVKQPDARSKWIWGAFRMSGRAFHDLHALWREPDRGDEYIGTLVNAYLARGGTAIALRAGTAYVDVGTVRGYREAINLLSVPSASSHDPAVGIPAPTARLSKIR
jgi:dTDP-glucose pyrophosphorylase